MKKTLCILCALLCLLPLGACAKKQADVKQTLEDIPNAYVGDVDVEQTIEIAELKIVIKKQLFYINDVEFHFKDFEDTEKRSTNFENGMLDVYVTDGALQKCVVFSPDNQEKTEYNVQGKGTAVTRYRYDEYGNTAYEAHYGADGKLTDFYTASYGDDHIKMVEKRTYNATLDLTAVIRYEYDEKGELAREITYGPDLKLQDVKES